jgi:hypothetical protein
LAGTAALKKGDEYKLKFSSGPFTGSLLFMLQRVNKEHVPIVAEERFGDNEGQWHPMKS